MPGTSVKIKRKQTMLLCESFTFMSYGIVPRILSPLLTHYPCLVSVAFLAQNKYGGRRDVEPELSYTLSETASSQSAARVKDAGHPTQL